MKKLFDDASYGCSKKVTTQYSTSFSLAVKMLSLDIRSAIYAIYGFVRCADEIVDTFHEYDKKLLLSEFENELKKAIDRKISLNPILNAFQHAVHSYNIDYELIDAFLGSMRADLKKQSYSSTVDYETYIYGSADAVGLMCLKVFVGDNIERYNKLKYPARKLGSAFQKVNFLRDLKDDTELLRRNYFPHLHASILASDTKAIIIKEIENDFIEAYKGIKQLPMEAKFGVYTSYKYYKALLNKIKKSDVNTIMNKRIRISNSKKLSLLTRSFFDYKFNLI